MRPLSTVGAGFIPFEIQFLKDNFQEYINEFMLFNLQFRQSGDL